MKVVVLHPLFQVRMPAPETILIDLQHALAKNLSHCVVLIKLICYIPNLLICLILFNLIFWR
jgi:hypothetical protein